MNDLHITTVSDTILDDKAFSIAKNLKYDGYERDLASMVYKILDKMSTLVTDKSASSGDVKSKIMSTQELAENLHKAIIRKFEKRKVHSFCRDNVWGADLTDIELICEFNQGTRFLLCVIDIYI